MPKISETITIVLGGFGTFLLVIGALTTEQGSVPGLGSMLYALFHFFIVMIALPFLLIAIFKAEIISISFRRILYIESGLNAISMLFLTRAVSSGKEQFIFLAILELLPIIFLYLRREYFEIKEQDFIDEN